MAHTEECIKMSERSRLEQEAWVKQWPDYCRKCSGVGGFFFGGCGYEPPSWDVCLECTDKGLCPRCKGALQYPDTGEGPCTVCGWKEGDDCLPELWHCDCYMKEDQWTVSVGY